MFTVLFVCLLAGVFGKVLQPEHFSASGEECHIVQDEPVVVSPLNSVVDRRQIWTNNRVPYVLDPSYSAIERQRIIDGINDIVMRTRVNGQNCISMLPRTTETDYVNVERNGGGCGSLVGRQVRGGMQRLMLAPACLNAHGTIMHQFLHTLGFYHEISRGDRDTYVTINWSNIRAGAEGNFRRLLPGVNIDHLGTPYDYDGVMHYGRRAFAINSNIDTITTTNSSAINMIGQRTHLSEQDVERIKLLYGCIQPSEAKYWKKLPTK